jgi:hypothetical protein
LNESNQPVGKSNMFISVLPFPFIVKCRHLCCWNWYCRDRNNFPQLQRWQTPLQTQEKKFAVNFLS